MNFMLPMCRPGVEDSAQGFLSDLLMYFFRSSPPYVTQPSLHVTNEVYCTVIPTTIPVNRVTRLRGNKVLIFGAPGVFGVCAWKSIIMGINIFRGTNI